MTLIAKKFKSQRPMICEANSNSGFPSPVVVVEKYIDFRRKEVAYVHANY